MAADVPIDDIFEPPGGETPLWPDTTIKALFDLEWHPALEFEETVKMTVEWYKEYYQHQNQSMYDFTISQIEAYTKVAKLKNIAWASND